MIGSKQVDHSINSFSRVKQLSHNGIGVFTTEIIQQNQTFFSEQPILQLLLVQWYNKFPVRMNLLNDARINDALIFALTIYSQKEGIKNMLKGLHPRGKDSSRVQDFIRLLPTIVDVVSKDPEWKYLLNDKLQFRDLISVAQVCAKIELNYFICTLPGDSDRLMNIGSMAVSLNHSLTLLMAM